MTPLILGLLAPRALAQTVTWSAGASGDPTDLVLVCGTDVASTAPTMPGSRCASGVIRL